ncbi:MAG TPA: L-2-hydroxyglutarate oxidase [Gaiellaceae bacterium]|nr:L-2-hydroxyglutarate oxidase [Gaiellaceae bacterium]
MAADVVVVGGGIVGLASALALSEREPTLRLTVLEKEAELATHQSGHNSGVVHSGLYYQPGSLKASLCREGRAALEAFCREHGVPLRRCGKLVVAVDESELDRLAELKRRGLGNGLQGLAELDEGELREIEPHVTGIRGLHVPETAVVDFRLVAARMADALRARGVRIELGFRVTSIERDGSGLAVGGTRGTLAAHALVACAGLQADRIALLAGAELDLRVVPFRGAYWVLRGGAASLVRGLIYPVPDPAFPFLGVHFTRRFDDTVWVGPNAMPALAREGYQRLSVSVGDALGVLGWPGVRRFAARYGRLGAGEVWRDVVKGAAVREMRRYLPALRSSDVVRGPSGVRAQVMTRSGELVDDFLLAEGPRSLHVVNAPSPAATSSLAIGRLVAERTARLIGL